jgi:hypothetical protein
VLQQWQCKFSPSDAQVNESTNRRILEKKKEKEEDIKLVKKR